ncbi:MAG: pyridoxal phosphate-dependent aminotransferase [Gammaproteobacteria bacterium]
MFNTSERVKELKPSPTLSMSSLAQSLKAEGKAVISLAVGEPDFDTPEFVKEAAIRAIQMGYTKYTPTEGISALRQAIVQKFKTENHLDYDLKSVMVTSGGKQAIYNLAQVYLNPGDEVIVPSPYWVSYPDICLLAGAKVRMIQTGLEQTYKIRPEQLEQTLSNASANVKLFILNSPSNPTGMVYSQEELKALGAVLEKHRQILILSDDIYEHLLWEGKEFSNLAMACPQLKDRVVIAHGLSKTSAMTGWRIGFMAGPQNLIAAMIDLQSQSTSNPCSISQYAALEALSNPDKMQHYVKNMIQVFKTRHDYLLEQLNQIPGFKCTAADGAFYLFPEIKGFMAHLGLKTDLDLAMYLLKQAHLAMVPGSAFGASGYLRFSFATSLENLEMAIARLKTFV